MYSQPRFLQGVYKFEGQGLDDPFPLADGLSYVVPPGKRAQLIYFRAGNSTDQLIYLILRRDGKPMRYFPVGAKADSHVALAVVEDLMSDTRLEVLLAAPADTRGSVVLDIGLM